MTASPRDCYVPCSKPRTKPNCISLQQSATPQQRLTCSSLHQSLMETAQSPAYLNHQRHRKRASTYALCRYLFSLSWRSLGAGADKGTPVQCSLSRAGLRRAVGAFQATWFRCSELVSSKLQLPATEEHCAGRQLAKPGAPKLHRSPFYAARRGRSARALPDNHGHDPRGPAKNTPRRAGSLTAGLCGREPCGPPGSGRPVPGAMTGRAAAQGGRAVRAARSPPPAHRRSWPGRSRGGSGRGGA